MFRRALFSAGLFLCAMAIPLFFYAGCGAPVNKVQEEPAETKGTITGTVVDEVSDQPLPLTTVSLVVGGAVKAFPTDQNGQFLLKDIPPGDYTLTFDRIGFLPQTVVFKTGVSTTLSKRIILSRKLNSLVANIDAVGLTFADLSLKTPQGPTLSTLRFAQEGYPMTSTIANPKPSTNHSYRLNGLNPRTRYQFQFEVAEVANPYITGVTPLRTFSTDDGNPPEISAITAEAKSQSAVISFSTNEEGDTLIYYGSTEQEVLQKSFSVASSTMTRGHAITLSPLLPGKTYFFAVQSTDISGNKSLISIPRSFSTPELVTPILLPIVNLTRSSADVHWEVDSRFDFGGTRFAYWQVEVYNQDPRLNSGIQPFQTVKLTEPATRKNRFTGLLSGVTYYFYVKMVDAGLNSQTSDIGIATTFTGTLHWDQDVALQNTVPYPKGLYLRQGASADGTLARGFIVGLEGRMARFANSASFTWSDFNSQTTNNLHAIAPDSTGDNAIAVGDGGTMVQIQNQTVSVFPSVNGADLKCIDFDAQTNWYYFGGNQILGAMTQPTNLFTVNTASPISTGTTWLGVQADGGNFIYTGSTGDLYLNAGAITGRTLNFNTYSLNAVAMAKAPNPRNAFYGGNFSFIVDFTSLINFAAPTFGDFVPEKVASIGDDNITGLAIFDLNIAYAVTSKGFILKRDLTTGTRWEILNYYPGYSFTAIHFDPLEVNGYRLGGAVGPGFIVYFRIH